jgi:hypothetical protein
LIALSSRAYSEKFIGKELRVLWETSRQQSDGSWHLGGLSDNYLNVSAFAPEPRWNQIDPVILRSVDTDGVQGGVKSEFWE